MTEPVDTKRLREHLDRKPARVFDFELVEVGVLRALLDEVEVLRRRVHLHHSHDAVTGEPIDCHVCVMDKAVNGG